MFVLGALLWRRYSKEWEKTVKRIGRWIDFENDYKTLDPTFMESVWWVFKQLWDKEFVYRGFKVHPEHVVYCLMHDKSCTLGRGTKCMQKMPGHNATGCKHMS